ncbi:hypothetical protein V5F79_22405 [Xanthobacter flavus]|uniref:hypothetical protein n=1 Tax=Xanthobacter flavus TaxID=281 RepID=UPI00372A6A7B
MTDRPILFSAPMILALLNGMKTQTRRVLADEPLRLICRSCGVSEREIKADKCSCNGSGDFQWTPCAGPRFRVGDRLWVRESLWAQSNDQGIKWFAYAADGKDVWPLTQWHKDRDKAPSIHMPRWTSRLTLYVTDVRVERLQDISEQDARAEGIECDTDGWRDYQMPGTQCCANPIASYRTLWDSINGPGSWDENPFVAAYTFAVRHGNIDTLPATLQEAA